MGNLTMIVLLAAALIVLFVVLYRARKRPIDIGTFSVMFSKKPYRVEEALEASRVIRDVATASEPKGPSVKSDFIHSHVAFCNSVIPFSALQPDATNQGQNPKHDMTGNVLRWRISSAALRHAYARALPVDDQKIVPGDTQSKN